MARRDDNESDDDDDDDRPRRRTNTKVPCPECGGRSVRPGPWPWYLGTAGALLCRAVICNGCGHDYDEKKPGANLATRKRNLAIGINAVGLLGIIGVFGGLAVWLNVMMK